MTILVTGGDGQLGTCLKKKVYNSENKWIFLSRKDLDITNIENIDEIFERYEPNVIINCAAYTNVDKAPSENRKAYAINELGPLYLTICARHYDARIIHISTDFVFSGEKNTPYNENDETNPLSVYGLSKLAGENAILKYENSTVVRTSWLYSEYGNNFFKTMVNRIKNNQSTNVVNDQIGTPTYAMDLAGFLYSTIEYNLDKLENRVYHYSNEGCCSWYDFAKLIEIIISPKFKNRLVVDNIIKPISTKEYIKKCDKVLEIRPSYSVLDKSEVNKILKFPIRHWFSALKDCINRYSVLMAYDEPEAFIDDKKALFN